MKIYCNGTQTKEQFLKRCINKDVWIHATLDFSGGPRKVYIRMVPRLLGFWTFIYVFGELVDGELDQSVYNATLRSADASSISEYIEHRLSMGRSYRDISDIEIIYPLEMYSTEELISIISARYEDGSEA